MNVMVAEWQLGILRNTDNPDYLIWILLLQSKHN